MRPVETDSPLPPLIDGGLDMHLADIDSGLPHAMSSPLLALNPNFLKEFRVVPGSEEAGRIARAVGHLAALMYEGKEPKALNLALLYMEADDPGWVDDAAFDEIMYTDYPELKNKCENDSIDTQLDYITAREHTLSTIAFASALLSN